MVKSLIGVVLVVVPALVNLVRWRAEGRRLPRYVHVLAAASLGPGLLLAWPGDSWSVHDLTTLPVYPALVYLAFGYFGKVVM